MTIKTHGRMMTSDTIGITQLALTDGTANQAIVTDGQGVLRFATVGAGGSVGSSVYVEDIRDGDGSTTTFTLSTAAPYEESILVFIDGVAQPTASFTLPSTTSITFSPAPGNGAAIRICHLGIASSVGNNSITGAHIAMGGDTVGDVLYFNGTDYQRLTIGTALQVFRTNAATTAPEWVDATTATLPATGADGNVLTSTGSAWVSETPLGGVGGELVSIQTFIATGAQGNTQAARGTAQTWTRPSGVKRIEVHLVGQGGNSQNDGGSWGGGNAGAGGYCVGIYDVTNTATATVTIPVAGDGTGNFFNRTWPSTFEIAGGTTMTAAAGAFGQSNAAGGDATGGALNFAGESGGTGNAVAHSHFGGVYGHGAKGMPTDGGGNYYAGSVGYCYIKEYSDASASLVGEKLASQQFFNTVGSFTWTRPANITKIRVFVIGSGGGTGGNASSGSQGGGGGGCAIKILDVTNITSAPVVVGTSIVIAQGGSIIPGTISNTTFNTTIVGIPGLQSIGGTAGGGGGATGGDFNISGSSGSTTTGGQNSGFLGGRVGKGSDASPINTMPGATGGVGGVFIEEYTDPSLLAGGLSGVSDEEYISLATAATTGITGVWTRPAGVTQIEVQLLGAGAGGGRNPQTAGEAKAGKGGDGGLVSRIIDVRSLATIDYYVGARGLGATSGTSGPGQNASFGHNGTALSTGLTVTVVSGVITAITNPGAAGSGMTLAPLIFIEPDIKTVGTAAGGTGATATATISGGAVTGITVTNGGTGYVQGSVIASFGLNAIGGLGGGNANGATPGNSPSIGAGFGNKGNVRPWTMGTEGRTPNDPTDSTHGTTIREFGVGGVGGGPTSSTNGGNGQHGGIYIRSYR